MILQENILNYLRKSKQNVTVYLSNGVPVKGKIIGFDNFTLVLDSKNKPNIIYKHSISTIIPDENFQLKNIDVQNENE